MNELNYFKLFYEALPLPVEVIDKTGKIVFTNKSFSSLWGYEIAELSEYNFFQDDELKRKGILKKINSAEAESEMIIKEFSDTLLKTKGATLPVLETRLITIVLNDSKFLVLFHSDKTEEMLNEAEIIKAREGNREAQRLKNTFLNVLSHELRTPLNIILGYSSIIKESMQDRISSEDKIYLENLHAGSQRLFRSITQMLEFAQIEAGNFNMNFTSFDIVPLIANGAELIKASCDKKSIKLNTVFKKRPIYVFGDIQCAENALNNLLENAAKFTKQGYVEIEADVIENRNVAVCKIKDTGVGISTEYLDHLFRPFSQEDLDVGRNFEGNGLGLALAKRYIEKMGGSLLADSIKGVGTTFTFTIPLSSADRL